MDRLPADVLAGVLRRLPARDLAECRCIRKEWRGVIDAGELLALQLRDLPRSLCGIFINYGEYGNSHLFKRRTPPPAGPQVDGRLDFMPREKDNWRTVVDHCNGLLLYLDKCIQQYYVCNPATQRWGRLPSPPWGGFAAAYLAFDPVVSLHYEVVLLPRVPDQDKIEQALGFLSTYFETSVKCSTQWPPAVYKMKVFSSRTGQWEERQIVQEGKAVVTLADVVLEEEEPIYLGSGPQRRYAEYWRGRLYIHCRGSYLTRLSLSDNKYKVVKTPTMIKMHEDSDAEKEVFRRVQPYLGRSEKGVYFVEIYKHQLWIWILNESHGLMEWILNHHVNLVPISQRMFNIWFNNEQVNSAWMLEDYDGHSKAAGEDTGEEEEAEENTNDNYDSEDDEGDEAESQDLFEFPLQDDDIESLENSDYDDDGEGKGNEVESKDESEWNSDDDYSLNLEEYGDYMCNESLEFLGFHPYKEVIFLGRHFRAVAYHLGSSKAQHLGRFSPCRMIGMVRGAQMLETFPYTPCLMDALPEPEK